MKPYLQVALDLVETDRAIAIATESLAGGADWLEIGTPLIKSEGMRAVNEIKQRFPDIPIVADMKIADTGAMEVEMAAKSGASIICILATADDAVISDALRAAHKYGVRLMADLINVPDPVTRSKELQQLGVHIINAHVGIDQQMIGKSSLDLIKSIASEIDIPLAIAGGLDAENAAFAVSAGASIVIVGGWITRSSDVTEATARIRSAIDDPSLVTPTTNTREDEIREIFTTLATPRITDAMHRKGSMIGITSICGNNIRAAGRAITVQTFAGDWAKPVQAIEHANPGDVLVINNDGGTHIAPWGELATLSAINRGIAGVIIDGSVRDVDDIRIMKYPLWARGTCPNAGEPKGFGEINAEIQCCGQTVRAGDWIIADENGVVVVPQERAYEVARRALEVQKMEDRVREEIKRGKGLAEVMNLLRWEKQ